jgi:hypothetical protein
LRVLPAEGAQDATMGGAAPVPGRASPPDVSADVGHADDGSVKAASASDGPADGPARSGEVRPAVCTSGTGEENSPSAAGADDVSMLSYGVVQGNTGEKCTVSGWLNIMLPMCRVTLHGSALLTFAMQTLCTSRGSRCCGEEHRYRLAAGVRSPRPVQADVCHAQCGGKAGDL